MWLSGSLFSVGLGAFGSSLFARRSFGLRALLFAMTLFAVVLGLAAAAKQSL